MVLPLKDDLPVRRIAIVTISIIVVNVAIWLIWQPTLRGADNRVDLGPAGNQVKMTKLDAFLFTHAAVSCELTKGRPLTVGEARLLVDNDKENACGQHPKEQREGDDLPLVPGKNIWLGAFLSMFLHANLAHIFGNMLFLFILGNNVEDRFGHTRYFVFYLMCGIAAQTAHVLMTPNGIAPDLGASGAIAGVMGAFLILFPFARLFTIITIPFPVTAYIPAIFALGIWFIIQFTPLVGRGVATWAHIGGFVAGMALAPLVVLTIRPRRLKPEARTPVYVNAY
jgi:membrane associated rhomboid family serine protease